LKICRDTREKKGKWDFSEYKDVEIIDKALHVGDYTLQGLESFVAVERKANIEEIYSNFSLKVISKRLDAIYRLKSVRYSFFILECSIADIYNGSFFSAQRPEFIMSILNQLMMDGINVIFSGGFGEKFTYDLFKKIEKKHKHERNSDANEKS
jgi:ERCC4-type nuclease